MSRFDKERVEDFKRGLEDYLKGMIERQTEIVRLWETYLGDIPSAVSLGSGGEGELQAQQQRSMGTLNDGMNFSQEPETVVEEDEVEGRENVEEYGSEEPTRGEGYGGRIYTKEEEQLVNRWNDPEGHNGNGDLNNGNVTSTNGTNGGYGFHNEEEGHWV
jgi:hypothetical protein